MQAIRLDPSVIAAARDNLVATPKLRMLLDDQRRRRWPPPRSASRFPDAPPDIICIDPIRNLFDGGADGGGENDNAAMMFFLQERVEALREAVAPDAGLILCHHTKKITKQAGRRGSVPGAVRRQRAARLLHLRHPHAPAGRGAAGAHAARSSCATARRSRRS